MARIVEYRDIPLDSLVIGRGQVRTTDLARDLDELARSIEVQGLLHPIVVCPATAPNSWEILTGQRRFLAHKQLQKETITAAILDDRVDAATAKAISITENILRRRLSRREEKDGITFLFKQYGSITDVVEVTGLPWERVRANVKYHRLAPEMKKLVDDDEVDVVVAIKAQDAVEDHGGGLNIENAVKLAREMAAMSGVQQKKTIQDLKNDPTATIEETIERGKRGGKVTQIIATVTEDTRLALRRFAKAENQNQDEAAVALIEDSLIRRGLLDDEA